MHTLVFLLTVMVQFPIFSPFYLLVRIITSICNCWDKYRQCGDQDFSHFDYPFGAYYFGQIVPALARETGGKHKL